MFYKNLNQIYCFMRHDYSKLQNCFEATKVCVVDSLQINLSALMLIDIFCTVLVISTTAMPIQHESVSWDWVK